VKDCKWAKVLAISTVVLLMAGLSVSCGGGGGKKSANSPDEYAGQVCDAIGKRSAEVETLFGDSSAFGNAEDPAQLQDAIAKAQPVIQGMADDLGKIEPPSEVKDWHEGMVTGMTATAELFGELKDVLDKPLDEAIAGITDLQSRFDELQDPFGSLSDLPSEYQDAFNNDPKCQGLDIFSQ
jgi:hypothetical protein